MQLQSGQRLGPYEIVERIGAGGMGEVYRARDTRLDRSVAIKILPSEFAIDARLQLRFEREAKAISQLNHPNICTVYDVGKAGDVSFLVMELIEGETLSSRIARAPLALDEAIRYAIEIAEALEKAHRAGVVHRDLKPGNVMITRSGAKLLDFGLARVTTSTTDDATDVMALTSEGAVVGTLQYMAPEQIAGGPIDARTDIFAFGAVLYEMLAGTPAFHATTRTNVVAAIVSRDPAPLSRVRSDVPPAIEALIVKCLAKDPDERWQCAGDLKWQLQQARNGPVAASPRARRGSLIAWSVAALAAVAAAIFAARAFRATPPAAPVHFSVAPPAPWTLAINYNSGPAAVSPNGRYIVFPAIDDQGRTMLWVRDLQKPDAFALPGTESAGYPFWSPDSQTVAFFASGYLKRVEVVGGAPPQNLCPSALGRGGTWSRESGLLFAPSGNHPLYRVAPEGGVAQQVTRFDARRNESSHRFPHFLPDGKHFLFAVRTPWSPERPGDAIYVASVDAPEPRLVLPLSTTVAYAEPGYLLFMRDQRLLAQHFNLRTLQLEGEPFAVTRERLLFHASGWGYFATSRSGVLAYAAGPRISTMQLMRRGGAAAPVALISGEVDSPRFSPDEQNIVYMARDETSGAGDQWLFNIARKVARRLTTHPRDDMFGMLTPDAANIVFSSNRDGLPKIFIKPLESNDEKMIHATAIAAFPESIAADGHVLAFRVIAGKTQNDVYTMNIDGSDAKPFAASAFSEINPSFSRTGRWIAYASNESGRYEVYAARYPGGGSRVQISTDGGTQPTWRGDEKEMFFIGPGGHLMGVPIDASGPDLKPGVPKEIATVWLRPARNEERQYDVTRDGQTFIVNTMPPGQRTIPMTVVVNWESELATQ